MWVPSLAPRMFFYTLKFLTCVILNINLSLWGILMQWKFNYFKFSQNICNNISIFSNYVLSNIINVENVSIGMSKYQFVGEDSYNTITSNSYSIIGSFMFLCGASRIRVYQKMIYRSFYIFGSIRYHASVSQNSIFFR